MSTTRTGKIARLPHDIREELNRRLNAGETGRALLAWLNEQPQVRAVLAADFGGLPINDPNLTAWRQGGYQEWLLQCEARELAATLGRDQGADGGRLTEVLTLSLLSHYSTVLSRLDEAPTPEVRQRWLSEMSRDLLRISRVQAGLRQDSNFKVI
jgi:hypothetical protein